MKRRRAKGRKRLTVSIPPEAAGVSLWPASRAYPKAVRLRRRREFLTLQRHGRRRHTPSFVILAGPGGGAAFATRGHGELPGRATPSSGTV